MTDAPDEPAEYLTVEIAADRLRVSARMVNEYGRGDPPRIRTKKAGRRVLYHAGDVDQLAHDLNVAAKPAPAKPADMSVYEPGPFLDYLREKDDHLAQVQLQLNQALIEVGRTRGLLEQMEQIQQERDTLRRQLADMQQSALRRWWRKLRGK